MDNERTIQPDSHLVLPQESLLFATTFKLVRVNCPFEVLCIQGVNQIPLGAKVMVDQVQDWNGATILYQICGKWFAHIYFRYIPPTRIVITSLK